MSDNKPIDILFNNEEKIRLTGQEGDATDSLVNFASATFCPLYDLFTLAEAASCGDSSAQGVAYSGKALMRRAQDALKALHDQLRAAGFDLLVDYNGPAWDISVVTGISLERISS